MDKGGAGSVDFQSFGTGDRKMKLIRKIFKNEEGATAIEYGLIAALIAVAAIAAMQNIGSELSTTFNAVADNMAV
jgi:pilus assembly protein Flp/PilA